MPAFVAPEGAVGAAVGGGGAVGELDDFPGDAGVDFGFTGAAADVDAGVVEVLGGGFGAFAGGVELGGGEGDDAFDAGPEVDAADGFAVVGTGEAGE